MENARQQDLQTVEPAMATAAQTGIEKQHFEQMQQHQQQAQLQFGQLSLDLSSHRVSLSNNEIPLSATEFKLLWFLASHAGTVLSRQQVFLEMTGRDYDGLDRRIDMLISVLRRKLSDSSSQPQRIKTVWGQGYLFVADAWQPL